MATVVIIPALIFGAVVGLLEVILLAKDVSSRYHFISHAAHAFTYALLGTFAVMNVSYVLTLIPAIKSVPYLSNQWVFRGIVGLIGVAKVHAASAVIPKGAPKSMKETWTHSLIVGLLIFFSPEIWGAVATVLPWKFK